jgi:hypothetical protein
VQADELAQHVRRIIWRSGELDRDPDVYVTTTVNFGDRPAGCIPIAATRETKRMFGGGRIMPPGSLQRGSTSMTPLLEPTPGMSW